MAVYTTIHYLVAVHVLYIEKFMVNYELILVCSTFNPNLGIENMEIIISSMSFTPITRLTKTHCN